MLVAFRANFISADIGKLTGPVRQTCCSGGCVCYVLVGCVSVMFFWDVPVLCSSGMCRVRANKTAMLKEAPFFNFHLKGLFQHSTGLHGRGKLESR
jgi:hypothetical protein